MRRYLILFIVLLAIMISACQKRDCPMTVAENHAASTSDKDMQLLWERMKDAGLQRLHYEVSEYQDKGDMPVMKVLVSGAGVCGFLSLDLSSSDASLKPILETRGKGYYGAEIKQPIIIADSLNGQPHFRLLSAVAIAD